MSLFQTQGSVMRTAAATAVATIVLAASVYFVLKASNNSMEAGQAIVPCTATGGLAKYAYCQWQEPTDNTGSGAMITELFYSVGKSPVVVGVDFTIGASSTASGRVVWDNVQTASGYYKLALTGSLAIGSGNYLRGVTLKDPTSSHTASMYIKYLTRLSPK